MYGISCKPRNLRQKHLIYQEEGLKNLNTFQASKGGQFVQALTGLMLLRDYFSQEKAHSLRILNKIK